ncbi:hypothetical protein ACEWY4_006280 [Coilia grayii]|uniref:Uncharacterized protein n=1 Tax=Coilia grayii TaxID=363190 RepID=A0ABD1KDA9_9TELE
MHKNIIAMCFVFQLMSFSAGRDDEWVDYTDMLRYDAVAQSMTSEDDPCAKCYKTYGLWAPLIILKHAPPAALFKLGLTLLIIVLGHKLIGALLWRGGNQDPHNLLREVDTAQQRTVDESLGEEVNQVNTEALEPGEEQNQRQQIADDPGVVAQCLEHREERDNSCDTLENVCDAEAEMSLNDRRPNLENQPTAKDAHVSK